MYTFMSSTHGYVTTNDDWGNPFFWVVLMVLFSALLVGGFILIRLGHLEGEPPRPVDHSDDRHSDDRHSDDRHSDNHDEGIHRQS
jgi:hypothetical protein